MKISNLYPFSNKLDFNSLNSKFIPSFQLENVNNDSINNDKTITIEEVDPSNINKDIIDWTGSLILGSNYPSEYINPLLIGLKDAEIYWHLRSMSKLKKLKLPNLIHVDEIENLKKKLPDMSESEKELEMAALKVSVAENSNPRNGIWEIKIKPVELLKHRSDQMKKKDL